MQAKVIKFKNPQIIAIKNALALAYCVPRYLIKLVVNKTDVCLYSETKYLANLIKFLARSSEFKFVNLIDIAGVDWLNKNSSRFSVYYELLSIIYNRRISILVNVGETTNLPSITKLFSAATWYERETWELFGIFFFGNRDLRRLLTDYGFNGYPFRRDFPLSGYEEVFFAESLARIIYVPTSLKQDPRASLIENPWAGKAGRAPGASTTNTNR